MRLVRHPTRDMYYTDRWTSGTAITPPRWKVYRRRWIKIGARDMHKGIPLTGSYTLDIFPLAIRPILGSHHKIICCPNIIHHLHNLLKCKWLGDQVCIEKAYL